MLFEIFEAAENDQKMSKGEKEGEREKKRGDTGRGTQRQSVREGDA